jgi:rhomboid family GlyGly-CTERM serine protease
MTAALASIVGQGRLKLPWLTFAVAALTVALHVVLGPADAWLILDRTGLAAGEAWRVLTGHFVHLDGPHLFWNVFALVAIGGVLETELALPRAALLAAFAAGAAAVGLWVGVFMPELARYAGLSGVLNTLFAVAVVRAWRQTRHWVFIVFGVGALAKILFELAWGHSLVVAAHWSSVPEAHLVGLIAGFILSALFGPRDPANQKNKIRRSKNY